MAKVDLYPDFKELFKSLNANSVEYLLIGGYAVIYYGYHRVTDDLDIWIAINERNAERISKVMQEWGGFSGKSVPPTMFLEKDKIYIFGREPVRIDILTGPSGVEFDACYARKNVVEWDGIRIPLIALMDLRANKIASGRLKDRADLENLPPSPSEKRRTRSKGNKS